MKSGVAGIIDHKGDLRIVITEPGRLWFHLNPGERIFVLPGVKVTEPVPWHEIPALVQRVRDYVARQ